MFCRILSLRYLWHSCKQLYVAMCLHNLIKRTLITLMPHLGHNLSLLHRDLVRLLSNLTIQFSSFCPSTWWSMASVSKKKPPVHYSEHSFLFDPFGAGQRCEGNFFPHIICSCWDCTSALAKAVCVQLVWRQFSRLSSARWGFCRRVLLLTEHTTLVCAHHQQRENAVIIRRDFLRALCFPLKQSSFS